MLDSSDDDQPLGVKLSKRKASIEKQAAKDAKIIRANEAKAKKATPKRKTRDESDDDVPLAKASSSKRQSNGVSTKKSKTIKRADSDSDEPIAAKAKKATTAKGKSATPAKKPSSKATKTRTESEDVDEEEKEGFEWWNAPEKEDDSIKWETLEHNGVLFPPAYTPLPSSVKFVYGGIRINLHLEAEEVAWFFGSMLHSTQNVENPVFQKNFFRDFQDIIKSTGGATDKKGNKVSIKEFEKCDFTEIHQYWQSTNEAKKARSSAEKAADKAEKDKLEAPFLYCKWDGRKEKVGNFRVEPPSLFRGRGDHPKTGTVKKRVAPEQVTINIGKDAKVPEPPAGHKWKAVQHDNKATWLAMWQENVNGNYKYVMLSANSAIKGQSDFKKFEKARQLKGHIDKIRKDYTRDLKDPLTEIRQRATAMYLIDRFALRAGNDKNAEEEAETAGCCSLKFSHVTLEEPDWVIFDFLGKDSIRYYDKVQVERQVFKNLKLFKRPPKSDNDDLFDRLDVSQDSPPHTMPGTTTDKYYRLRSSTSTFLAT
jgi:DNA topoisomerase I